MKQSKKMPQIFLFCSRIMQAMYAFHVFVFFLGGANIKAKFYFWDAFEMIDLN